MSKNIESLYLGWRELDNIYKNIKYLERGLLFIPDDRELGYVQKANLYIQDASVRIHGQWENLSVIHYIHPDFLRDYLTLREKGLRLAIDAIGYDENFIEIYRTSIEQKAVLADMDKALIQINELKGLMTQIRDKMIPFCNIKGSPIK